MSNNGNNNHALLGLMAYSMESAQTNDDDVKIKEFLDGCENLTRFLTELGSAFTFVVSDVQGNVAKVRQHSENTKTDTIRQLVQVEIDTKSTKVVNSATDALLWLSRAVQFINVSMEKLAKDETMELKPAIEFGYEQVLSQHHNFFVRQAVYACFLALPYRKRFDELLFPLNSSSSEKSASSNRLTQNISNNLIIINKVILPALK